VVVEGRKEAPPQRGTIRKPNTSKHVSQLDVPNFRPSRVDFTTQRFLSDVLPSSPSSQLFSTLPSPLPHILVPTTTTTTLSPYTMSDDVIHYSRKGFDDDEDELSQLEALLEPEVRVETGFDSIVFVENTPVVAGDKYDKLVAVLLKIFNTCGRVVPNGLHMPINPESLKTEGYIILLLIVIVQYAP
jgi:hypothetical protein